MKTEFQLKDLNEHLANVRAELESLSDSAKYIVEPMVYGYPVLYELIKLDKDGLIHRLVDILQGLEVSRVFNISIHYKVTRVIEDDIPDSIKVYGDDFSLEINHLGISYRKSRNEDFKRIVSFTKHFSI